MAVVLPNPPNWMQNRKYSARLDRTFAEVLFGEGVLDPGAGQFAVTQNPIGLDNSVQVAPGIAFIDGDDELNQGTYIARLEVSTNVALGPAPTSLARIDLLVLRVNDSTAGSSALPTDAAVLDVIEGAVSGAPVLPALPDSAIPIASVLRTLGDTFIDNAMITDERTAGSQQSYTVDSRFEQLTTTERNALTPFTGQTIYNTTTNQLEYYDGANWVGPTAFSGLSDVDLGGLVDQDLATYSSGTNEWVPISRLRVAGIEPENAQTGTTYTLALTDLGKLLTHANASPITLTVPTNASVAFPAGSRIDLVQYGAGQVTIAAASGVTINSKNSNNKLTGLYAAATLWYRGSDVWILIGDLES
jgi:hypothetical protein